MKSDRIRVEWSGRCQTRGINWSDWTGADRNTQINTEIQTTDKLM